MKYYYYIIIISILFSCKKTGSAVLEGTVYEEGSGVPIPNAYIRVKKTFKNTEGILVDEATTDRNGRYKIRFHKGSLSSSFYLDVISGEHVSNYNYKIENRKTSVTTYLSAYAYCKVRVKNNLSNDTYITFGLDKLPGGYWSVKANSDSVYQQRFRLEAFKKTQLKWNYYWYFPSAYNSPFVIDSILITNKFDTLIYFIQIN